ncbi:hypothetical protein [Actinomadura violacea]|uniref:Uncharacterized protein n=1 Tax=Actinomadura violacea TaxID=2819934 RepID=A0ABS3RIS1_9ACTN|nr:hypothetical protein [Actinomadura violacea]MBO2456542.1 hypothetical protein [Actinomadura violacea]
MSARPDALRVAQLEAEVETLRTALGMLQKLVNALYEDGGETLKAQEAEQQQQAAEVADRRAAFRVIPGGAA